MSRYYRVGYLDAAGVFHDLDPQGDCWEVLEIAQKVAKDDYLCGVLVGRLAHAGGNGLVVRDAETLELVSTYDPEENVWNPA